MIRFFGSFILFIFLLSIFSLCVLAKDQDLPIASGYVNDFVNVVSLQDQQKINNLAKELESKTSAQVAVAIVNTTAPETIEGYAVRLFKEWGIGQKVKDNGVLFLIANEDHTLRIEVGYGLEGVLTDVICSKIIDSIVVPNFKQGQISQGIVDGMIAIVSLIAKEYGVTVTGQEAQVYESLHNDQENIWIIILVFLLIFLFFAFSFSRPGVGWYGGGGGFGRGSGSSGGFGGFGGGRSGGGGASGRW